MMRRYSQTTPYGGTTTYLHDQKNVAQSTTTNAPPNPSPGAPDFSQGNARILDKREAQSQKVRSRLLGCLNLVRFQ
jgi:hypothetical protein